MTDGRERRADLRSGDATSFSGGASRRRGIETDLTVRATPALTFDASLMLNDATYRRFVTEDGDSLDGARVFNTARWVGTAGVPWRLPRAAGTCA